MSLEFLGKPYGQNQFPLGFSIVYMMVEGHITNPQTGTTETEPLGGRKLAFENTERHSKQHGWS